MPATSGERSRRGPLFWVLTSGGIFLVFLFGGLLLVAYFAASDQKANGMEGARIVIQADPDNEILKEDPVAQTIRYRNKKTGQESLVRLDPVTHEVKIVPVTEEPAK